MYDNLPMLKFFYPNIINLGYETLINFLELCIVYLKDSKFRRRSVENLAEAIKKNNNIFIISGCFFYSRSGEVVATRCDVSKKTVVVEAGKDIVWNGLFSIRNNSETIVEVKNGLYNAFFLYSKLFSDLLSLSVPYTGHSGVSYSMICRKRIELLYLCT